MVIIMIIKRFKESRETMDIKQLDLTFLFGVTNSTISGWETGKDTIPIRQLIKYANKYNYSLDYLFGITNHNELYKPLTINLKLIGNNLRKIRKANGKTQQEVADIINTSQASYAHYENAVYLIPTNFLFNLSKLYKDFSIDEILGRHKL